MFPFDLSWKHQVFSGGERSKENIEKKWNKHILCNIQQTGLAFSFITLIMFLFTDRLQILLLILSEFK